MHKYDGFNIFGYIKALTVKNIDKVRKSPKKVSSFLNGKKLHELHVVFTTKIFMTFISSHQSYKIVSSLINYRRTWETKIFTRANQI